MPDGHRPAIPQVSDVDDLFGTHTVDDRTVPANFAHHNRITPRRTPTMNGSNVIRCSVA
jgi:hypothetical protein